MKIYTKTGDKGKTSLFNGQRVYKNNIRVETYGTIDELNSIIGICISMLTNKKSINQENSIKQLQEIQNDLFDIGAVLANPTSQPSENLINHWIKRVKEFEILIDSLTSKLPEITNFILPGGSTAGSFLHLARTVTRRAERNITTLSQNQEISSQIMIYLNRLSDLFFTLSRYINLTENQTEIHWKKTE